MYYGVFGDTNGATPEVIGEASYRMGTACFPNDHISGANGHGAMDVTCES
jgi:chitosanase